MTEACSLSQSYVKKDKACAGLFCLTEQRKSWDLGKPSHIVKVTSESVLTEIQLGIVRNCYFLIFLFGEFEFA